MVKDYLYYRELYHWGILGQKKGHRRFQNEDGSLTPEGKERYRKTASKIASTTSEEISKSVDPLTTTSRELLNISRNISTKKGQYVRKDYSDISDKDLRDKVNRLNLERQYGDLTGDTKYVMSGSEKAREILQTIGSTIAVGASSALIFKTFYDIINGKRRK